MKLNQTKLVFITLLALLELCSADIFADNRVIIPAPGEKTVLHSNWWARRANEVLQDGNTLSASSINLQGWLKARVPGTVLGTLLDNKLYQAPEFGMNNNLIPDIYQTGNDFYTYWFVRPFEVSNLPKNRTVWINFRGINYMADIFLNGKRLNTHTHAVADETEPGSTFKVASIMVALDDGLCHPTDTVDVGNGVYMYKGARMTDHNADKGGYHRISVEQAIWYSSNIGVAKTILKAYEKDPVRYAKGLYRTGMNANLHLEIPGAGRAKIRMPNDRRNPWSKTTLPWMSFGYETQIPPIYTLTFFNAIANNGTMVRPMFVKEIMRNGKSVQKFETEVVKDSICKQTTLAIIRGMLENVVEKGTGKAVHSDVVRIAGKTGTAQIAQGGVYRSAGHQVAFCGYFPAEDPRYTCIVVIRQPNIGYPSGGTMSGAVVKNIAEKIYSNFMPYDVRTMARDSAAVLYPLAKAGNRSALEAVLAKLKVGMDLDSLKSGWVIGERMEGRDSVRLKNLDLKKDLVPNVVGMGAKDAVYLMEKVGLRVSLDGLGSVSSQSIVPGTRVLRGQTIRLILN